MRVIIAGSRSLAAPHYTRDAIYSSGWQDNISEVVCGMCAGPDLNGKEWAEDKGIPVEEKPAKWQDHPERHITRKGRSYDPEAGRERNIAMAKYANAGDDGALIAVWDGKSKGTAHMIAAACWYGLWVYVYRPNRDTEG